MENVQVELSLGGVAEFIQYTRLGQSNGTGGSGIADALNLALGLPTLQRQGIRDGLS